MQRLRPLFTIALLATASSCGDAVSPRDDELALNRQRWAASGYRDYTMLVRLDCFVCENGPYNVTVVNDSSISATFASDGRSADARRFPTITGLFDFIDKAIDTKGVRIDVQYDATLGYPRQVNHVTLDAEDGWIFYTLSDVKPRATAAGAK